MRSVPIAMTWELLQRGRWQILLGFFGANLLPVLLLTALRMDGMEDYSDPSLITLQTTLIPIHIFTFGAVLFSALDSSARAFTLPIPTTTLVAWRLIPAMLLVLVEMLISLVALNTVFGVNWPIWGPVLFAPASMAMVLAALWYADKSPLLPACMTVVGVVIGVWYKLRYGPLSSLPTHGWVVTPMEIITLVAFIVVSYVIAVAGVSRSRRGDVLGSQSFAEWMEGLFDWMNESKSDSKTPTFRTPQEAQFWSEWRKKGWVLPTMVVFGAVITSIMWLLFSRDPLTLFEGLIGGAGLLSALGLTAGLVVGSLGATEVQCEIGSFLATRPLTNVDLARTILKLIARSVVISWLLYMVAAGLVLATMWFTGTLPQSPLLNKLQWWYWPATLLGCWMSVAMPSVMMLSGRSNLWAKILCTGFVLLVLALLCPKLADRETQELWFGFLRFVSGVACAVLSIWIMFVAYQRSLIKPRWIWASLCAWMAISAVVIVESWHTPAITVSVAALVIGVSSFVFTPLAAAPLAVTWNRHR